jgi:hypothetical protein
MYFGPPKSAAGRRTIHDSPCQSGGPLRPSDAVPMVGLGDLGGFHGIHFHDLRYTGKTLAADTWASLADLMARMGHGSARAALRDTPRLRPACRAWLVLPHPEVPWMRVFDASAVKAKGPAGGVRTTHSVNQKRADFSF